MKARILGDSDLNITPIGFGAWAVGGDWKFGWGAQDDADSVAAIHRALELGVNWILRPLTVSGTPKRWWPEPWPNGRMSDPTSLPSAA
jgi:hypothetical protein